MCRLVESLRVFDNRIEAPEYHQARMDRACLEYLRLVLPLRLPTRVPARLNPAQVYKMRVVYSTQIELVEFLPYQKKDIRSLRLIENSNLDYTWKYEDRAALDALLDPQNPSEHLLFVKDGLITDSSYANVALLRDGKWFTPARPLLQGTRRARLIDEGILSPGDINPDELRLYEKISLINAMLPLGDTLLKPSDVHW